MPLWLPTANWLNEDVFIIGGGHSLELQKFDWTLLHSELTIGCNTAFKLGTKVCKICFFGDPTWFNHFKFELADFEGAVFTNHRDYEKSKIPWLWYVPRQAQGLHNGALGWNGNTGAAAINLAFILGAKRVYLLGFDMQRINDKSNWHEHVIRPEATKPYIYKTFIHDFRHVVRDWHAKFGDKEIWNITADSGLSKEMIPWIHPDKFWAERKAIKTKELSYG
jgi:hypothetical protein